MTDSNNDIFNRIPLTKKGLDTQLNQISQCLNGTIVNRSQGIPTLTTSEFNNGLNITTFSMYIYNQGDDNKLSPHIKTMAPTNNFQVVRDGYVSSTIASLAFTDLFYDGTTPTTGQYMNYQIVCNINADVFLIASNTQYQTITEAFLNFDFEPHPNPSTNYICQIGVLIKRLGTTDNYNDSKVYVRR